MKVFGFYNKDNTRHKIIPLRNIRYCETKVSGDTNNYYIRVVGVDSPIEISEETYSEATRVMESV